MIKLPLTVDIILLLGYGKR